MRPHRCCYFLVGSGWLLFFPGALKPLADHHLQITCQSLSLLEVQDIRCERWQSCRPTENTVSIDTESHLYVTHSHCMQHTGNPPCSPCLMYAAWHRESGKLKERFGTREGFEICPNQFFQPLIFPPLAIHQQQAGFSHFWPLFPTIPDGRDKIR